MGQSPTDRIPKRPRGRPAGTAPFEQGDMELSAAFADTAVLVPGAKLAPFLAKRGYGDRQIRRAQKRWRSRKAQLLRQAQLRADATPSDSLLEFVAYISEAASTLMDAARPAFQTLAESLERARRRLAAREELGMGLHLPLDPRDRVAVDAAVARYDQSIASENHPAELDHLTTDKLPWSLKLYYAAVTLHYLSLQAAQAEDRQSSAVPSSTSRDNT